MPYTEKKKKQIGRNWRLVLYENKYFKSFYHSGFLVIEEVLPYSEAQVKRLCTKKYLYTVVKLWDGRAVSSLTEQKYSMSKGSEPYFKMVF